MLCSFIDSFCNIDRIHESFIKEKNDSLYKIYSALAEADFNDTKENYLSKNRMFVFVYCDSLNECLRVLDLFEYIAKYYLKYEKTERFETNSLKINNLIYKFIETNSEIYNLLKENVDQKDVFYISI
jgi:hypothetical protein